MKVAISTAVVVASLALLSSVHGASSTATTHNIRRLQRGPWNQPMPPFNNGQPEAAGNGPWGMPMFPGAPEGFPAGNGQGLPGVGPIGGLEQGGGFPGQPGFPAGGPVAVEDLPASGAPGASSSAAPSAGSSSPPALAGGAPHAPQQPGTVAPPTIMVLLPDFLVSGSSSSSTVEVGATDKPATESDGKTPPKSAAMTPTTTAAATVAATLVALLASCW